MKLVISCLFLAIAAAACSSATETGTNDNDLKVVCDPLKCSSGEHWSSKKCKCVADCTEMWMCTTNEHWDADLCKCVPDIAPSTN
jgi:hypothetical protein